jgi:hypothetical protein
VKAQPKGFLKTGTEAKALVAKEQHKTTGKPPPGQADNDETLSKLPVWQRTSTKLAAKCVSPTGGAILAYSDVAHKGLPYVEGWKKILKEIDWHKHGLVAGFLRDVIYWHHRSTNGRFNDKLGRFERWGVKSVAGWNGGSYKVPNPYYEYYVKKNNEADLPVKLQSTPKTITKKTASDRHFLRHKDRLAAMGLIEAESHFRVDPSHNIKVELKAEGKLKGPIGTPVITALWVKPTEELSRIIFEPGYWEKVRAKYAFVPTKKKPRGMHAKAKNEASGKALQGPMVSKNDVS